MEEKLGLRAARNQTTLSAKCIPSALTCCVRVLGKLGQTSVAHLPRKISISDLVYLFK